MSTGLKGSCLCGGVRYACSGPLTQMARCYCIQCRKASGGECATNAMVARGSFRILAGGELLREFESSPGQMRVFCGQCGSPVYKRYANDPEAIRIRTGLLDDPIDEMPQLQVFVSEKLPFTIVDESIPSFERGVAQPAES
ncbi:MAG: GFA family protein [Myxococcota bacterium]